jgi:hypothetical protein
MKTKQQLIEYAERNNVQILKAYMIKINGKFVRKPLYRGYKSVWSSESAAWQALQLIITDSSRDSKETINPVIQSYIDEGFIEIIEV